MTDLCLERVRVLLDYNPDTGVFMWKSSPARHVPAGSRAGRLTNTGVRQICIDGRAYTARRLAWFVTYGAWPASNLEVLNGRPDDDRMANLALVRPSAPGQLTAERLRQVVNYDRLTGQFSWASDSYSPRREGGIAGAQGGRYRCLTIDGLTYRANRLAVLYVTGAWPAGQVDHIDGNTMNDAWGNLRDVTPRVNSQNQRKAHSGSTSGRLGVYWRKDREKFQATITVDGERRHLGLFECADEAHAAYLDAKRRSHPGCTI